MRLRKRIISLLLAAALLLPAFPAAQAAERGEAAGTISATLRVDLPQSLETLRDREVQAELFRDGRSLGVLPLTEEDETDLDGFPAVAALRNQDGGALGGGNWPGYLDLTVSGLPRGNYELEFTGTGYVSCRQALTLEDCSQHVTLGTGDASFTLGDVDGDGRITEKDRELLSAALGSGRREDLRQYDLSGDGVIDICDLAYVSRGLNAQGSPEVRDTALLAPPVDVDGLWDALNRSGVTVSGDPEALFLGGGEAVTFSVPEGDLTISVPLLEPLELAEVQIVSPEGAGAPESGSVTVEYEDGALEEIPFDRALPEGVHAIGPIPGASVVTIPLGRRVAVKEITITVTRAEGGAYTVLESIQFLRDIVPENPVAPNSEIKNLTADPGDGRVSLRWRELPNVSSYRVDYQLRDGGESRSLRVDRPQAEVTGLENLKTYLFTVTPVDGSWQGKTSDAVAAMPQPSRAPDAPDMVSVSALDSALTVSWKASKAASYYEVWYKAESEPEFRQWESRLSGTSTVLTDLTNGVTYSIYIKAGNSVGLSGPSRTALGTPLAADYSRPEGIPAEGVLDWQNIERVWLAAPNNVSPTAYPSSKPFQPEFMADGDFSTHWTSHSYGDGNWWDNKQVFCTFKQPVDLSAVIWVPRLDGGYASNLRVYTVTVWRQGDDLNGPGTLLAPSPLQGGSASDVNTWLPVQNNPAVTRFAVLPFEPVTDVVKIAVTIEQRAYTAVSLSELMFMEYDPARCLPDNIADLFAGELCTTLRPGVTQAEIDALRTRLNSDERNYYLNLDTLADELDLAEALLRGEAPGRVLNGLQSRSSAADSRKYGQGGSELQPLGAAARAGEEITIYASGIPAGETVTVYATQFNAEASAWQAQVGTLKNGRNVLTVPQIGSQDTPRGGSLYVTYSGGAPQEIRLHIRRAAEAPLLALDGWYGMSEGDRRAEIGRYVDALSAYVAAQGITSANRTTNCLNVTELSLPSVLLSLPAAAVLNALGPNRTEQIETLYANALAWEDVMHICKTTQGIDKTYGDSDMTSRQNIRCMQMFAGAFMYAAGSHIGIGYGSCGGMVCGKPLSALEAGASVNRLFGWGIAHEIGHNMDKLGKAEITNNIYSLMVQTADGDRNTLSSRLERENRWPSVFSKTAAGLPGDSNNVFTQLGLYWQLHLAYDSGNMEFYNRFFKEWKAFSGSAAYGDKLALTASKTAGRNLTEFFTRWGVSLSEETRTALAAYPAEERAVWYLSDQSRRDRLAGKSAASGTVSLTAEKQGEKEILLTLASTAAPDRLQGYEILRNGVPIGFTAAGTYTDVIGSANHRTYTYTVRAYDTLGNCFAEAGAPEIRIAYDKTIDPAAYTLTRSGDTVTVAFEEETAVSGLKLTQIPAAGTFSAAVTDGTGNTVTARQGDFSQGNQAADDAASYLTYFQKPGAPETDTRIWTYDAKTVTVTGVPEEIPDEAIQLVSYAGDDVFFLETGSVGLLSAAYQYGTGADQILPAGTLVVVGSYRGDPLYQTVKIEGRFVKTAVDENGEFVTTEEVRPLDGRALLFAEIPDDGAVSDISDGLFLFVPNVQREAELQGEASGCAAENLLPSQMRAVLSRTDLPDAPESQRVTAETLWIDSPGGSDLPVIVLEEG